MLRQPPMVKHKQTGRDHNPGQLAGLPEIRRSQVKCFGLAAVQSANLASHQCLSSACQSVSHAYRPLWFALPMSIPTPLPVSLTSGHTAGWRLMLEILRTRYSTLYQ